MVGRAHAVKLSELGHDVMIGTRDPVLTLKSDQTDAMVNEPFQNWLKAHPQVKIGTIDQASARGEMVINALHGQSVIDLLSQVTKELTGKILLDISNPLDFSHGFPPTLFVANTDSLGEQIQHTLPETRVVKSLNTVTAFIQVNPATLASGDHHVFVCGNDLQAKAKVTDLLKSYGWVNILDLGDITSSRGTEMLMALWARLFPIMGKTPFNYKIVIGDKI